MKILTPCRSKRCKHVQCFDGGVYIQLNEKKATWICPVCDIKILYDDIYVDELWSKIVKQVPESSSEIEFNVDGSWTYITNDAMVIQNDRPTSPICITIDDSDDETVEITYDSVLERNTIRSMAADVFFEQQYDYFPVENERMGPSEIPAAVKDKNVQLHFPPANLDFMNPFVAARQNPSPEENDVEVLFNSKEMEKY